MCESREGGEGCVSMERGRGRVCGEREGKGVWREGGEGCVERGRGRVCGEREGEEGWGVQTVGIAWRKGRGRVRRSWREGM